jgi:hypothetical protein
MNHPILCLGYRFEYKGKVFCTAYDTEPYANIFCTDPNDPSYDEGLAEEGAFVVQEQNALLEQFFAGADFLVYDAQYTEEEYKGSKIGWGHSPVEYAVAASKRAGVKKMALFHHEPMRTDAQIDALARLHCHKDKETGLEVIFAQEGLEVVL